MNTNNYSQAKVSRAPRINIVFPFLTFIIACLFFLTLNTCAEEKPEKPELVDATKHEMPKLTNDPASGIQIAGSSLRTTRIQDSLTLALLYLRTVARKDETGLFVAPKRYISRSGKTLTQKCRKVTFKHPIYEYEYYKSMVRNSAGELVEVTRKRIKKITGYKEHVRLVPDKNGKFSREIPIWVRNGPDILSPGLLGQNAMAVYVSLKCGVSPDDEQLLKTVSTLVGYLDNYIPDRTWDLAWLTMAFVNLPKDNRTFTVINEGEETTSQWTLKDLSQKLVNKLLTGQITAGKKTQGLWGPVCLNAELLSKMLPYEQKVIKKKLSPIKAKLKAKPDNARLQGRLEKAKEEINDFLLQYLWISKTLHQSHIQSAHITYGAEEGRKRGIIVSGLPCYYVGEQLVDLESTALVLYALREAQLNGYLPKTSIVPKDLRGKDFVKPQKTSNILRLTADALLKLQKGKKAGSEVNIWLPEHRLDSIEFPKLPFDDKSITSLKSPVNDYSNAYTYMALRCIYDLLNPKNAGRRFDKPLHDVSNVLPAGLDSIINNQLKKDLYEGHLNIYKLLFGVIPYCQDNQAQGVRLTEHLLANQACDTGSWLKPAACYMSSSSLLSYFKNLAKQRIDSYKMPQSKDKNKKIVNARKIKKKFFQKPYRQYSRKHAADITATSTSMLLLIDSLRQPAFGVWGWNGKKPTTAVLNAVVKALREESGVTFRTIQLPTKLTEEKLNSLPILFIAGSKDFKPEKSSIESLKNYLNTGGLIIVESPGTSDGFKFIKEIKNLLTTLLPEAKSHIFPKQRTIPALNSLLNGSGYIAAVFIPLQNRKAAKKKRSNLFSSKQSTYVLKKILRKRLGPEYLSNTYAINWESFQKNETDAIIIAENDARKAAEKATKKKAEVTK